MSQSTTSLLQSLKLKFPSLSRLSSSSTRNTTVLVTTTAATAAIILLLTPSVIADYRAWYSLGAGGVPHNPVGWVVQFLLKGLAFKDRRGTGIYDDVAGKKKSLAERGVGVGGEEGGFVYDDPALTYLHEEDEDEGEGRRGGPLPERKPSLPSLGSWAVPHRQLDQHSPEDIKRKLQEYIDSFASTPTSNTTDKPKFHISTSLAERHGPALFLSPHPHEGYKNPIAMAQKGEIIHMHSQDGSSHVVLSNRDAKTVLEKGWGERHPLSGVLWWRGIVLVYAPRDEAELMVVERIVRACVGFVTAGEF